MVITKPAFSSTLELLKIKHKCIKTQRQDRVLQPVVSLAVMTYPGWDCKRPSVLHSGLNVGRPPEA